MEIKTINTEKATIAGENAQYKEDLQAMQAKGAAGAEKIKEMEDAHATAVGVLKEEIETAQKQGAAGAAAQEEQEEKYNAVVNELSIVTRAKEEESVEHENQLQKMKTTHEAEVSSF